MMMIKKYIVRLIKGALGVQTEDDIFQPNLTNHCFRVDFGYISFVFKIRYQEIFTAAQLIKVEFKFGEVVQND